MIDSVGASITEHWLRKKIFLGAKHCNKVFLQSCHGNRHASPILLIFKMCSLISSIGVSAFKKLYITCATFGKIHQVQSKTEFNN